MAAGAYTLENYVEDLRAIAASTEDEGEIITRVQPLAQKLARDRSWLKPEHYETDPEQGFGVHMLHEESDHLLPIFVIAWQPGRGAPPHDHGTWAVVAGVDGNERNTLYKRLDDKTRAGHAELAVKQERSVGEGDVIAMRTGGIHSVVNDSDKVSVSLHTYGRHFNYTGRSQFDLETQSEKSFIVTVD